MSRTAHVCDVTMNNYNLASSRCVINICVIAVEELLAEEGINLPLVLGCTLAAIIFVIILIIIIVKVYRWYKWKRFIKVITETFSI